MKKILLLLVLTLMVGAVNAKTDKFTCNVTFPDNKSANCDYNTSTKSFSWSQTNSNSMRILKDLKGNVDLSKYKWLNVKVRNLTSNFRILIYCDNNGSTTSYNETFTGDVRIDLTNITLTTDGHTYANINNINIAGSGSTSTGSLNIEEADCYLETDEYETMSIQTSLTSSSTINDPINIYTTSEAIWDNTTNFVNKIGQDVSNNNVIYGHKNGSRADIHFYVTGYDKVQVNLTTAASNQVRFFGVSDSEGNLTIATAAGTTKYEESLNGLTTFYNIKSQNSGSAGTIKISSINFIKDFDEISSTDFNIAASNNSTVKYNRTFVEGRKSTVCLPFALTTSEVTAAGKFYELKSVVEGVLHFDEVTETEAYKPYVFEPSVTNPFANLTGKAIVATPASESGYATTVDDYTFQGVLAHQNVPENAYGYNASTGAFSKATTANVTIDAFRAYIKYDGLGAREIRCDFGDEITGINDVKSQKKVEDDVLYNLSGQRVSPNHKGIVIKNGRKYMQY